MLERDLLNSHLPSHGLNYRINHKCVPPPQCTEGSGRTAHRAGGPVRTKRGIAYLRGLLAFSVVG